MLLGKVNQFHILKGSGGKTSSISAIGACLASVIKPYKRVLMVDIDPQADLSKSFGKKNVEQNMYGALTGEYEIEPITILDNLDLLPAHKDLYSLAMQGITFAEISNRLKEIIEPLKTQYDHILIDCHADMSLLTMSGFAVSDTLFIPMKADYLTASNVPETIEALENSTKNFNPSLKLGGIFLTFVDQRLSLHKKAREIIEENYGDKLLTSYIRNIVAIAESPSAQQDIFTYAPNSLGALDYLNLTKELLGILN